EAAVWNTGIIAGALVPDVEPPAELRSKATLARNSSAAGTRPNRAPTRSLVAQMESEPALRASTIDSAYCPQRRSEPISETLQARTAAALKGAKARAAERRSRSSSTRSHRRPRTRG